MLEILADERASPCAELVRLAKVDAMMLYGRKATEAIMSINVQANGIEEAMDFQNVVDSIEAMTCVVSVEKLENGRYGDIRIVTGNHAYIDSIENPAPGTQMLTTEFVPNSIYTRYLTQDLNFEDYCYRSAVQKKCLHSYAHPDRMDVWFNMTFLPIGPNDGNIYYCTYTMEINFEPSTERLSNVSGELASAVLETSLKLSGSRDFKATMDDVIKDIRELCESEYCCVFLLDEEAQTCKIFCEDLAEGSDMPSRGNIEDINFFELAQTWEDTIAGSNCLIVKSEQDMEVMKKRNPLWQESLAQFGVETIVLFPIKFQNELLGYMWTTNFEPDKAGRIKETLELTTYVLGLEISSHQLMNKLRVLSSRDMLTGLLNRNEMNNRIDSMQSGKSGDGGTIGVVFADLNGLKRINDAEGHDAGDELLKNAACAMRDVFNDEEAFRVGGDEFLALMVGVTEQDVARKIEALREAAKNYKGVVFAIGGCVAQCGEDVSRAMRLSDELMYKDKQVYYETHPKR